jgi:hypothetical protein
VKRLLTGSSLAGAALLLLPACGSSVVHQPPGRSPTPSSVSVAEPGGDASDPHQAALRRQLASPWGYRTDKDEQIQVPLPDWEHWKRVRYWGIEHFVGFRYGKEHHAMAIVFVQDASSGEATDSRSCLRHFELWARPQLGPYDVKLQPASERKMAWRGQPTYVRSLDGSVSFGFSKRGFSAAWAAYPAYPSACLVYAIAVPWDTQPELARRVRDRWLSEGFGQIVTLTAERPYRK